MTKNGKPISCPKCGHDFSKWKTQKEYKKSQTKCPKCNEENVSGATPRNDNNGNVIQICTCHSCGAKWKDRYKLIKYERV